VTDLASRLRKLIAAQGPLTVAQYVSAALLHPVDGYYTRRDPLGEGGDFTTAPEISQMFGELIGLWCAAVWLQTGRPPRLQLIELGPGRGTLMADALRAAASVPAFRDALAVHLVEASPVLAAVQRRTLAAAGAEWHASLDEVPADAPVIVIANEFFDALPVRQFVRAPGGWHERLVDAAPQGEGFRFVLAQERTPAAALIPPTLHAAPEGTLVEISPAALRIAADLGRRVRRQGGAALLVDFGRSERAPGATLQAVRGHRHADVLDRPGAADLAAHVDFAGIAQAAAEAGASVHGPVTQGAFLSALGIGARAEALRAGATREQAADLDAALHRLTAPDSMGHLFKVLAIADPALGVPPGFEQGAGS